MVDLPKAIHEGAFTISGVALRCYHLDDGSRIINAEDVHALFAAWEAGAPVSDAEAQAFGRWYHGRPDA